MSDSDERLPKIACICGSKDNPHTLTLGVKHGPVRTKTVSPRTGDKVKLLTGQEFYERFAKEFEKLEDIGQVGGPAYVFPSGVLSAAKKASGLE